MSTRGKPNLGGGLRENLPASDHDGGSRDNSTPVAAARSFRHLVLEQLHGRMGEADLARKVTPFLGLRLGPRELKLCLESAEDDALVERLDHGRWRRTERPRERVTGWRSLASKVGLSLAAVLALVAAVVELMPHFGVPVPSPPPLWVGGWICCSVVALIIRWHFAHDCPSLAEIARDLELFFVDSPPYRVARVGAYIDAYRSLHRRASCSYVLVAAMYVAYRIWPRPSVVLPAVLLSLGLALLLLPSWVHFKRAAAGLETAPTQETFEQLSLDLS